MRTWVMVEKERGVWMILAVTYTTHDTMAAMWVPKHRCRWFSRTCMQ